MLGGVGSMGRYRADVSWTSADQVRTLNDLLKYQLMVEIHKQLKSLQS